MRFKLYYDDSSMIEGEGWEAWKNTPLDDVVFWWFTLDPVNNPVGNIIGNHKYYVVEEDGGVNWTNDLNPLLHKMKFIKFGRNAPDNLYERVRLRVQTDAQIPFGRANGVQFQIYYDDETMVEGEGWEAFKATPSDGVLFFRYTLNSVTDPFGQVLDHHENYVWEQDGEPHGLDDLNPLLRNFRFIKFGGNATNEVFERVRRIAEKDDLVRKGG